MSYDALDRLTRTESPMFDGTVATYEYDVLDNLTHVVAPGRDQYYCYNGKWQLDFVRTLPCHGGGAMITLAYDAQGNLASKNTQNYAFDYGNRLRSATGVENYRYDVHGRRVLADKPGTGAGFGKIFSLYSNDGQLLWTRDERASKRIQHVYLAGSLIAQRTRPIGADVPDTITYQHTDALGSPVAVTNSSRSIIETSEFEPYGKLLNRPLTDGPGYTGHVSDAATGLSYMQQRYYDPSMGRFLSVDPVTALTNGDMRHFNRYGYAYNNPYKFTDPDGRNGVTALGGVITESWNALNGRGFDSEMVRGALFDGYDGEGSGIAYAALMTQPRLYPEGHGPRLAGWVAD
jgi:RHS repeat-associated protein